MISYVLMRGGEPPFVVSADNAADYFEPSSAIGNIRRHSLTAFIKLPRLRTRIAEFLQRQTEPRYLLPSTGVEAAAACRP